MRKNVLWKSDLWLFTLFFGLIAIQCLISGLSNAFQDRQGETFAIMLVGLLPMGLAVICAVNDHESLARWLKEER